jgi:hypothetical protein
MAGNVWGRKGEGKCLLIYRVAFGCRYCFPVFECSIKSVGSSIKIEPTFYFICTRFKSYFHTSPRPRTSGNPLRLEKGTG